MLERVGTTPVLDGWRFCCSSGRPTRKDLAFPLAVRRDRLVSDLQNGFGAEHSDGPVVSLRALVASATCAH